MIKEIRIGGFGGQGVILSGLIIGKAATLFDKKNSVQTQSYGPEARGGASKTEVLISDEEITYPKVENPDILVVMSHEALLKYHKDLKKEGILIVDPDLVHIEVISEFINENKIEVYEANVTKIATEEIGLKIVANIVMVGVITKITKLISIDSVKKSIIDSVPKGTEEKNLSAFEYGYNYNIS
ncbi:MAG: 2-oxoacid:ferredoxin oxidoreductase subunit gamma [Methanobrevibacter sp.]|jgi:2-oxoglutarate ferredoxin oxidoreductase subunit gamma|nr:2-oxoacid:ferredoxin oxidoreductase subunit gamma [Methanobrevibacter sp.]